VVERYLCPIRRNMTLGTILSVTTGMFVVFLVAGITGIWRTFEYLVHVAGSTRHRQVFPG
jgi:hypothetical protein